MNKKLDAQILERYLKITVQQFENHIIREGDIQINCNICGDSEHKNKLRGHLKRGENDEYWYYKCFNGGCPASTPWSAKKWLKETDISNYKQYCKEGLIYNSSDKTEVYVPTKVVYESTKKLEPDVNSYLKSFRSINYSNELIFKKAIHLCKKRKIPKHIYDKFMVCTSGPYRDRLIIPFYDDNDEIYYFQARTLVNKEPKYLNMKGGKDNSIYNLYNIDKSKPVIVTEGPIDSMFIENSIAVLGLDMSKRMKKILDKLDCYYLFDNDLPGKKYSNKFYQNGKKVFIWEKFKHYDRSFKDVNDVVLQTEVTHFKFEDLKSCFNNSYSDYRFYLGKYK